MGGGGGRVPSTSILNCTIISELFILLLRWRGAEERLQRMVSSEGAGVENLELELEVEEVKKSSKSSPPLPSQPTTHKEPEERWQKNGTSVEEAASTRPTNLSRPSTASRSYSQHSKEYYSDHPKSGTVPSYRGTEPRSRYLKPKTGTYNSKSEPRTHPQKFRETRWHSRNAVNGDNSNESSEFSFFFSMPALILSCSLHGIAITHIRV